MENSKIGNGASTSVYFQLICIALSAGIITFLVLHTMRDFHTLDEAPELLPITPAAAEALGGTPAQVRVGLNISNFSEFSILRNEFIFSGTLWFLFDPSIISLDTVKKFSFEKGEILNIAQPATRIIGNKLLASFDIKVKKADNLNHAHFPFSSHTFNVVIDSHSSPAELSFVSSIQNFVLSKSVLLSGWKIQGERVETGYTQSALQENNTQVTLYHPRIIFSLDFAVSQLRQLLTILLPLILLFYLTLFTFSMNPTFYYRSITGLSSGIVTALIAYRFVIENLSPKVGYFMLSDYIFFLFLGVSCAIFMANTQTLEMSRRQKEILTIVMHGIILVAIFYLLNYWIG